MLDQSTIGKVHRFHDVSRPASRFPQREIRGQHHMPGTAVQHRAQFFVALRSLVPLRLQHQVDKHRPRPGRHQPLDQFRIHLARPRPRPVHQLQRPRRLEILRKYRVRQIQARLVDPQHDHIRIRRRLPAECMHKVIHLPFQHSQRMRQRGGHLAV